MKPNPKLPTKAEITGIPKQPLYTHRVITCSKCNQPGGTLVKVGDNYIHKSGSGCNT